MSYEVTVILGHILVVETKKNVYIKIEICLYETMLRFQVISNKKISFCAIKGKIKY